MIDYFLVSESDGICQDFSIIDEIISEVMDALLVQDLIHETCYTILKIGAPILLVSLSIGFLISLLQALTQVQEATVSFVPKLLAILLTLIFAFPYMSHTLMTFAHKSFNLITVRPFGG